MAAQVLTQGVFSFMMNGVHNGKDKTCNYYGVSLFLTGEGKNRQFLSE